MKKGVFGDVQVQMFLGKVGERVCLISDAGAWDDLRTHSPDPTVLVRDVFDLLKPTTQHVLLDIMSSALEINRQYGDPYDLDREGER